MKLPDDKGLPRLGLGFFWQDLQVGQQFQTFRRTVTETDLVNFISVTGMLEMIFIDAEGAAEGIGGRPVRYGWGYGGQMIYVFPGSAPVAIAMTSDPDQPSARTGYRTQLHALAGRLVAAL